MDVLVAHTRTQIVVRDRADIAEEASMSARLAHHVHMYHVADHTAMALCTVQVVYYHPSDCSCLVETTAVVELTNVAQPTSVLDSATCAAVE
jgi:hypothetical protein